MKTRVALLRGINVGGRNSLPMAELITHLESLGLKNVATYIQSGNVVFSCPENELDGLTDRIQDAIQSSRGFAPGVTLLDPVAIEAAVAANPFTEAEADPKSVHLFFLASTPVDPDIESLEASRAGDERYELIGSVFYLHAPSGIGRSRLAQRIERCLGAPATGRNWRTVRRLLDLARATVAATG